MRFLFAFLSAKLIILILRLLGRNASFFAGKIALKIFPDFLARIPKPKLIIAVTGTNGKTSVNNLLSDSLQALGRQVLSNRYGSNVNAGIAAALVSGTSLRLIPKFDTAVLEVDERSAKLILPFINPALIIVTNLFRDSMRRNAHPQFIAELLSAAIPDTASLILNADDIISAALAPLNPRRYFSIAPLTREPIREQIVCDSRLCPLCSHPLSYSFKRYHHIGIVSCTACDFTSPSPDFLLTDADFSALTAVVRENNAPSSYPLSSPAIYNAYNTLAVIAALRFLGYSPDSIANTLSARQFLASRFSSSLVAGKKLTAIMAKGLNAVACSRTFNFVADEPGTKAVFLMLDDVFDEKHSSENIAWLYDADFEYFNSPDFTAILVIGKRAPDYLFRLLLAGIPQDIISTFPDPLSALNALDSDSADSFYILYELYRHDKAQHLFRLLENRLASASGGP